MCDNSNLENLEERVRQIQSCFSAESKLHVYHLLHYTTKAANAAMLFTLFSGGGATYMFLTSDAHVPAIHTAIKYYFEMT